MPEFRTESLIKLRNSRNMSQSEVARYVGVSVQAVSQWEKGISCPSIKSMTLLTKLFNKPLAYFMEEEQVSKEKHNGHGMESITELYKIGRGPSSSHTIGPEKACMLFKDNNKHADKFKVILYGSLAKTGIGHGTDSVIVKTFAPVRCEVVFDRAADDIPHPNTMDIIAFENNIQISRCRVMSVGGGSIKFDGCEFSKPELIYKHSSFNEIAEICRDKNIRLWQYVEECENSFFGVTSEIYGKQ